MSKSPENEGSQKESSRSFMPVMIVAALIFVIVGVAYWNYRSNEIQKCRDLIRQRHAHLDKLGYEKSMVEKIAKDAPNLKTRTKELEARFKELGEIMPREINKERLWLQVGEFINTHGCKLESIDPIEQECGGCQALAGRIKVTGAKDNLDKLWEGKKKLKHIAAWSLPVRSDGSLETSFLALAMEPPPVIKVQPKIFNSAECKGEPIWHDVKYLKEDAEKIDAKIELACHTIYEKWESYAVLDKVRNIDQRVQKYDPLIGRAAKWSNQKQPK